MRSGALLVIREIALESPYFGGHRCWSCHAEHRLTPCHGRRRCRPEESAYNPIGAMHAVLVCALLDAVLGCVLHSTLPQGEPTPRALNSVIEMR